MLKKVMTYDHSYPYLCPLLICTPMNLQNRPVAYVTCRLLGSRRSSSRIRSRPNPCLPCASARAEELDHGLRFCVQGFGVVVGARDDPPYTKSP